MPSRKKLITEYRSFEKEVKCKLKEIKPDITLFGSYVRHKKTPNDIDVHIDVGQLTENKFVSVKRTIATIKKKYPDVDPVLYSWPTKQLPSKSKRNKLRWNEKYWEEYPSISRDK